MRDIKFALPHLSPSPLRVPWTCRTPALTAAIEFATALPVSSWQCIPRFFPGTYFIMSITISSISWGRAPPLVSHRVIHLAPESTAATRHLIAKSRFDLNPSKKCSASNITSLDWSHIYFTESPIISVFSESSTPKAIFVWKSQVFPTMQTASVFASDRALRPGSLSVLRPDLRVIPNAVSFALLNVGWFEKKLSSVGLAPGHPPSI